MTGSAGDFGANLVNILEFQTEFLGRLDSKLGVFGDVILGVIGEIVDFLQWTEVLLWIAVALETPAHRKVLGLIYDLHLVHVAMAVLAGNPPV